MCRKRTELQDINDIEIIIQDANQEADEKLTECKTQKKRKEKDSVKQ